MRIIEENKTEEIIHTCSECGCKFAYTEDDVYSNIYGKVVSCPSCKEEIIIERFSRPLQFPDSYYYFGGKDCVLVGNETIEKEVKRCIKYCLEHNECQWCTAYGNMFIEVNWIVDDGFFEVLVTQNYYDNHISEEEAKELIANFND